MSRLRAALEVFDSTYSIGLDPGRIEKLLTLDDLLLRWNPTAGLFRFRTEEERIDRYFLESLHASLWATRSGLAVDLGSGGGSPALPLAVCLEELEFRLVEPRRRKALFLEEAIRTLGLRAMVLKARLETLHFEDLGLVTSRGLATARTALDRVARWMAPGGRILLFTGREKSGAIVPPPNLRPVDNVSLAPGRQSRLVVLECFT